jgi:hypothetical protein
MSRDTLLGITTAYGLDGRGSIPGRGKICLLSTASRPALRLGCYVSAQINKNLIDFNYP